MERAIEIVERALERFGPPVYVGHEIVHNKHVVATLKSKGARFVDEVDEIPSGAVAVFSAHGVAGAVELAARERGLRVIDAAGPLVTKVHHVSAGASAPELLVQDLIGKLAERYAVRIEILTGLEENVHFRLPPELAAHAVPAALDRPSLQ